MRKQMAAATAAAAAAAVGMSPVHAGSASSGPAPSPDPTSSSAWSHPLLHNARVTAAYAVVHVYTVRPGDTLAGIAAKLGIPNWADLWWWNRSKIKDPNVITAGQVLTIWRYRVPYASWEPYVTAQADAAIPKPPPPPVAATAAVQSAAPAADPPAQPQAQPQGQVSTLGMSAFEQCVIQRESGGNVQIWNASGHWGAFQFDEATWVSGGGSAASFGNASFAVQQQVFDNVYAARGTEPWAPSDGC